MPGISPDLAKVISRLALLHVLGLALTACITSRDLQAWRHCEAGLNS